MVLWVMNLLVFCLFVRVSGRTIYIRGFTKQDFALWHSAIQLAAGRDGRALSNQQLSKNDVPIIVDSCVAFVTQYGNSYSSPSTFFFF